MSEPEHSPLPWFVGAQNDGLFIIDKRPRPSTDDVADIPGCTVIAKVYSHSNARLIVTAVNSHGRLIAAAKAVMANMPVPRGARRPEFDDLADAIAAAEEQAP